MKKLLLLAVFVAMALITAIGIPEIERSDAKYELYIPTDYAIESNEIMSVIHTGAFDIVKCDAANYDKVIDMVGKPIGRTVRYDADKNEVDDVIKKYNVVIIDKETSEDGEIIYGYSTMLGQGVQRQGDYVNIQICYKNGEIAMGIPLIMGSY